MMYTNITHQTFKIVVSSDDKILQIGFKHKFDALNLT